MKELVAIILCYNESQNIRRCLESISDFCDVHVVDSGSTDDTLEICREYTSNVHHHTYSNHASQWKWALETLPIESDWILALDADFVVTPELMAKMRQLLPNMPEGVDGIYVRHDYFFGGGRIRFGGTKKYWLRVVRRSKAGVDTSDLVDFRFLVDGETVKVSESVEEHNYNDDDISIWLQKQDKFSVRLAVEEELRRRHELDWEVSPSFFGNPDERIMWLRDRWLNMPLFLRPFLYFVYRYFIMLGFLDGKAGFLYHFLQGWWLRLVVDWKTLQIRNLALSGTELNEFRDRMLESNEGSVRAIADR